MNEKSCIDVLLSRKSVRHYSREAVSKEDIETMLRTAMAAPSAVNRQPWSFIAITEREQLDILGDGLPYAKMLLHAPAAVVVCGESESRYWVQDCSAATENLLLAAEALGYGSVWTAVYPDPDRIELVRSTLDLPEEILPLNVIPIGIPEAGRDRVKDKWEEKKIHWQRW